MQGSVELDVLILHWVWLPFLPGEVTRRRHPPSSRKGGELQHLGAGQQCMVGVNSAALRWGSGTSAPSWIL